MNSHTSLPMFLAQATDALAENLLASQPLILAQQASNALESDTEAGELWQKLMRIETRLRQKQSSGNLTASDMSEYRTLQSAARENEQITAFLQSQQAVQAYVQETNQEISQKLGVDFGRLAQRSGCC
jgi:cell fate (sporulation/competence/biofilm development) regulator YlbF (YheA/YmcA/DUF963 family)